MRFRFSLRLVLVAVTAMAICLAWLGDVLRTAARQRKAVDQLNGWAYVTYDWHRDERKEPYGPWLVKDLIGIDAFNTPLAVEDRWNGMPRHDLSEEDCKALNKLEQVDAVTFNYVQFPDGAFQPLYLPQLSSLRVTSAGPESGLADFLRRHPSLRRVWLFECGFSPFDDADIFGNMKLEELCLVNCLLSEERLASIVLEQSDVKWLWVENSRLNLKGLQHLGTFASLEELALNEIELDEDAAAALCRCQKLQALRLTITDSSPGAMAILARHPSLKVLTIELPSFVDPSPLLSAPLDRLDLAKNALCRLDLEFLPKKPSLKLLVLPWSAHHPDFIRQLDERGIEVQFK